MECIRCGYDNKKTALYCNQCGEVITRADRKCEPEAPIVGHSYGAMPMGNRLAQCAFKAKRFIVVFTALLAVPLTPILYHWLTVHHGHWSEFPGVDLPSGLGLAALYLHLVYAYLTAKTGEATGAGFWWNFLLAVVPGLTPAAWARIGGRPVYKPYIYFALDAAIIYGVARFFGDMPYMFFILAFGLMPFLVHQFFGCAIGPIANALGFYPTLAVAWLCLVPNLLFGLLLWEMYGGIGPDLLNEPFALTVSDIGRMLSLESVWTYEGFKYSAGLYLVATLIAWIKTTYDDLKLPVM